jgi:hypothetical protein
MRSRRPKLITASLAAILLMAAQAAPVHAGSLLDFSLNNSNSISLIDNGDYTLDFLLTSGGNPIGAPGGPTAGEQAITISSLNGVTEAPPITAYLSLFASSAGHRPTLGSPVSQEFSGSFAITQNANGSGVNYLSGSFTDWTLSGSGSSATLTAVSPMATSSLTSSVIANLPTNSVLPFAFSDVTPDIHVLYENGRPTVVLAPFTAGGGTVPEPSSLVLAGFGALGVVGYGLRRRKASGV